MNTVKDQLVGAVIEGNTSQVASLLKSQATMLRVPLGQEAAVGDFLFAAEPGVFTNLLQQASETENLDKELQVVFAETSTELNKIRDLEPESFGRSSAALELVNSIWTNEAVLESLMVAESLGMANMFVAEAGAIDLM